MEFRWQKMFSLAVAALVTSGSAAELRLFANPAGVAAEYPMTLQGAVPERWGGKGVVVRQNGEAFEAVLSGTDLWPGFALRPEKQKFWDYSKWNLLLADVENLDVHGQVDVHGRIYTESPDGKVKRSVYNTVTLNPGEKRTLKIPFSDIDTSFGAVLPGVAAGPGGLDMKPNIYAGRVASLSFYSRAPIMYARNGKAHLRISNIRFALREKETALPESSASFFPFIDRFGQYIHGNWSGKIRSPQDLKAQRNAEKTELAGIRRISGWNRFGGWMDGPQLKATGFFRTEKFNGKWWLVDPDGRLFLSNGINAVVFHSGTSTKGRTGWFAENPKPGFIDFMQRNLRMKYGEPFTENLHRTALDRLEAWGMNTVGAWSDQELYKKRRIPYTLILNDWSPAAQMGRIRFYDAFDPAFARNLDRLMKTRYAWSINDPWCIGYFINNELQYGSPTRFAEYILTADRKTPGKQEFCRRLKLKYGTMEKLNAAWEAKYASWDDFLTADKPKFQSMNEAAKADLTGFNDALTEEFFRVSRDAVRRNAPNQLYLGARLRGTMDMRKPGLLPIAAKYCDVVSVNNYANTIAHVTVAGGIPDVPFLIGEFAFQVPGRGMFNYTLSPAGVTQEDRAEAFLRFWQGLLMNPNYVGAHWFCYRDQFLTGRGDGENYAHGFVDVCDTPYREMGRMSREVAEMMYRFRLNGRLEQLLKQEKK